MDKAALTIIHKHKDKQESEQQNGESDLIIRIGFVNFDWFYGISFDFEALGIS